MNYTDFPYKHISVLVMPTDHCNMNCIYCFNGRRTNQGLQMMSEATLTQLFKIIIPAYPDIRFIWHGGEPLLMGKEFYERMLYIQRSINTNGAKIKNSIQSNLTLMSKELAEFLVTKDFHIGSSFDGTTNEETRHNSSRILAGHEIVKAAGGHNGFICVVQSHNIDHLIEDYEWFKEHKIGYTLNQYLTSPPYDKDPLFVPAKHYVDRMCEFFDYWVQDSTCNIGVSNFEVFLEYLLHNKKSLCTFNSCMGKHIGIHFDGRIYGCNRDFPEEYCFGSVYDYSDIRQCFSSDGFNNLLRKAIERRNYCKTNCDYFDFCAGGCNSCALAGGNVARPNEYFCATMIPVYEHIKERVLPLKTCLNKSLLRKWNPYLIRTLQAGRDESQSMA